MGLDAVELVLDIEDAFPVKIPDEEAAGMLTVGDVFDYIVANADISSNSEMCLSAATFYSIRQAASSLGVCERLRPRDATAKMLPVLDRRDFWARLQRESELELPALCRPEWMVFLCAIITAVVAIVIGNVLLLSTHSPVAAFSTAFVACFAVGSVLSIVTRPLAVFPSSSCTTLRDLSERTLGLNLERLSKRHGGAHTNDLWVTLRTIIVEQLGVSPEQVTPSARFVNDLGCG